MANHYISLQAAILQPVPPNYSEFNRSEQSVMVDCGVQSLVERSQILKKAELKTFTSIMFPKTSLNSRKD